MAMSDERPGWKSLLVMAAIISSAIPGCAARQAGGPATAPGAGEPAPEESRKLGAFVYIEEGTDLVFTVGVHAAAVHENQKLFPLEISLINKQKGTQWQVTRESFTLIDEAGNRIEMATYDEYRRLYTKRSFANHLLDSRAVTAGKHEGFRQIESSFFPDPLRVHQVSDTPAGPAGVAPRSTSLVPLETLEVRFLAFFEDVLYFPHPEGQLIGQRLSLEFRATDLAEPARIAFRVPEL